LPRRALSREREKVRRGSPTPRIGPKIRHTRLLKGLTLRELADVAQCSESLLSKIENGRANPSLKMIHRIASALGTQVAGLFQLGGDSEDIVLRHGRRPVIETDQMRRGNGVQLEAVIPAASGHLLSGYINHIEPGGGSEGLIQHEGEEFGYVLEGEIELKVAGRPYRLNKGDTFHFRSERAHSYRNVGTKKARVLWLNTPPTF
jgi:transcriptional regulator with XRE-family HTH domain